MHGWFWFLLVGLVSGWLAGKIMRGGGFGFVGDILLGIVGAAVGGWLFGLLGVHAGGLLGSIVTATVGALLLLYAVRLIKKV